jgi:cis-L-3-hydroxyproline dehydratase
MVRIKEVTVYRVELPLIEGSYRWSGGKEVSIFDSTVVELTADSGEAGYGEVCPLGPAYLPAYAEGARTGIATLAPSLLDQDPTQLGVVNRRMDREMRGHPYVKSAIDMACWDILGKVAGQPITTLMGGRFGEDFPLYRAISQDTPSRMAAMVAKYRGEGYTKFQLKVGGFPRDDVNRIQESRAALQPDDVLVADANTGWTQHQALQVADSVRSTDVYLEQPCASYEECLVVRKHTNRPLILDEVMDSLSSVSRGVQDHAMDIVNLKISRVGGLTKAREIRDFCVGSGIALTVEDTWGGDIVTAAIAALAHSTPPEFLFSTTDFNSYVTTHVAQNAPKRRMGRMSAPSGIGLGVTINTDVLGKPIFTMK